MKTTYHGNVRDVSDIESDSFLKVNICGVSAYSLGDYTTIRERGRRDYQLMYIRKGKIKIDVLDKTVTLPAGSVIIYHPHEPQRYTYEKKDKYECTWVHFSGTIVEKMLKDLGIFEKRVFKVNDVSTLEDLLAGILPEHRLQRPGYEYNEAALIIEVLCLLSRNERETVYEYSTSRQKIEGVLIEMERNVTGSFPLEEYAKRIHLSPGRFAHLFTETVGMSPHRYMITLKLKKAKQLLRQTDHSVREIAKLSGFGDPMYFSRIFKKYNGFTPMQYRKSNSNAE